MSRAAGTLITTHNATYISPRFMPGYRGYCPTIRHDYGQTYGNATSKYFQDYRSDVLSSSRDAYHRGGEFPTYYTHNPDLVISNRNRTYDRYIAAPKYQLSNIDHDRKEELYRFDKLSHSQREHYNDKSGTVHSVDFFKIPLSAEEELKKNALFMMMSLRHTDKISLPNIDHVARRRPLIRKVAKTSSKRAREMRDVHFEVR